MNPMSASVREFNIRTPRGMWNYCEREFAKAKFPEKGKPVLTATRVVQLRNGYGIKYHDTIICAITKGDTGLHAVTLRTDGWMTPSTSARINTFNPYRVTTIGVYDTWAVCPTPRARLQSWWPDKHECVLWDGGPITICHGRVIGTGFNHTPETFWAERARIANRKRNVRGRATRIANMVAKGTLPREDHAIVAEALSREGWPSTSILGLFDGPTVKVDHLDERIRDEVMCAVKKYIRDWNPATQVA